MSPWRDHKGTADLRVGAAVRRRRRALELTLAVVAERSGLSVPFLEPESRYERARPSRSSLEKVADALRTTAVELLAAADPACSVDVVHAGGPEPALRGPPVRPWCAVTTSCTPWSSPATMTTGREFQHRNDELMYVADGAVRGRGRRGAPTGWAAATRCT